ncbi:MAG: class I SAM-dependent methyltransferase [Myxococcales bacterium]|nr:class I SAM-dependent methyltransferase [Myxococcales bacterium]MCB9700779.1 class I SAM-dependent methyltransferase [Myxococcales bacterium]
MLHPARSCPACGSHDARPAFVVAGFEHVRCGECDTLFVTPLPSAATIEAHYLAEDYHASAIGQEARMRAEADVRAAIVRDLGCRDILEIGSGPGHFLDAARALGMRIEGAERSPSARGARERGHTIHEAWLQELELEPRFDAVAMWEVLEHLPEPRAALERVRGLLRPGGHLALSTPSSSGLLARLMGARFVMVEPPAHLELFSRRGLERLLTATGFSPLRWTTFSGLRRENLRRGLQRYVLGGSRPAARVAGALAWAAEPAMRVVDRAGLGISFEVYAAAR